MTASEGWSERDREEWAKSYRDLLTLLESFGKNDSLGNGDFWLLDEDWANREHVIHLDNLDLLGQNLAGALQEVLRANHPRWIISITIIPPQGATWPSMGLLIRRDGVEDHLRREFLPPAVAKLEF